MFQEDNAACHGDRLRRLESKRLCLTADALCGGKLRSLISKQSGKEFFYQDRRTEFDPARGYSYHDIGGWDECFPNVAACRGTVPGGGFYDYPDHGSVWHHSWDARERDGVLIMSCELDELKCSFTRCCSFENENTLLLEYRIANNGESDIPYVYSAHPLLVVDGGTRVILPEAMTRAYCYVSADNSGFTDGQWFELSSMDQRDLIGPFRASRHSFVKLYSDRLEQSKAVVEYHESGERLEFTVDTAAVPYLGFLTQQGYDSLGDGYFAGECLLAWEPTTGIGDDLGACMRTNTLRVLSAGSCLSFWIRLRVERM